MGIPTMVMTREGFKQVVGNAFSAIGFAAEGPVAHEWPFALFAPGSDLTPINENIDKIVYGLTKWEPEIKAVGVYAPEKVTVQGKDCQEAVANMNNLFLRNMWSDGLPITPAIAEQVDWILTGTDLPRDTVVGEGKFLPRGGITTAETLAVALAMAGGRPEYLPVLLAAADSIMDPNFDHAGWNATTSSTLPAVIVNGPIAKQIRLNSGYGLLGPNPMYPANGPIGRAIRLIQQNVGGCVPGIGTMAIFGGMRFTNFVFAEDEEGLPTGWDPLSVERGFPQSSNVLTVFPVSHLLNLDGGGGDEVEKTMLQVAASIGYPAKNRRYGEVGRIPGIVLLPRGVAGWCVEYLGWSKLDTKRFLWENSKIPFAKMEQYFTPEEIAENIAQKDSGLVAGEPWPICVDPDDIVIALCGGAQSGHTNWMQVSWGKPLCSVSREIKYLPAKDKWDALLKQAEEDLGPIPV